MKSDLCIPPPIGLVGAYYLQPPDVRVIILYSDLLRYDKYSVTGGCITYWGGGAQTEQIPEVNVRKERRQRSSYEHQ